MVTVAIKTALMLLALVVVTACGLNRNLAPEGIRKFYCGEPVGSGAYQPVRWSVKDTDETIEQTKANNAVFDDTCK